ncbi:unnamed protein product [Lampetra fluviatilis]
MTDIQLVTSDPGTHWARVPVWWSSVIRDSGVFGSQTLGLSKRRRPRFAGESFVVVLFAVVLRPPPPAPSLAMGWELRYAERNSQSSAKSVTAESRLEFERATHKTNAFVVKDPTRKIPGVRSSTKLTGHL